MGGGIYCGDGAAPTFRDCTILGNTGTLGGGGVYCDGNTFPLFTGCTFFGNDAPTGAGLEILNNSFVTIENTIIAFNDRGEAVHCGATSGAQLYCCDLYGNTGGDWIGCIGGQLGSNGNISADPIFCDSDADDLHLGESSPCAPEQNPSCGLIGAWEVNCHYTDVAELPPIESVLQLSIPSPFPVGASIRYRLAPGASAAPVILNIYDSGGKLVRSIVSQRPAAGTHTITWDGTDRIGRAVQSGAYYCRLTQGAAQDVQSIIVVR